jgi:cytoskeletal protein CcmA (bactofilin family)/ribosomal protein S27E
VECPHCGFKQRDYAAAKTTMCRQCGAHFSPSAPRPQPVIALRSARPEANVARETPSLFRRFDNLWKANRNTIVECFECKRKQEVSGAASSSICPSCSAHIDLRDYKVNTSFSRSIRTHGEVHITAKGDLSSSNVRCRRALVEGRVRGNLECDEFVRIDVSGKIPGRIVARSALIERRAEVQFFRRLRVGNIEIRGKMLGEIVADGIVTIRKHAALEGTVRAKGINVEKGGLFSGQLVIGRGDLEQGELLPKQQAAEEGQVKSEPSVGVAQPLAAR